LQRQDLIKSFNRKIGEGMGYKIAVATSDGIRVDLPFGAADSFKIYQVDDNNKFYESENRKYVSGTKQDVVCDKANKSCGGQGCGGHEENNDKVLLVSDCRCVICSKIGFQIRKCLERKAITAFDIDIDIETALHKITDYFDKVDNHKNLRSTAH
jgi:predicted Fe-Mo cluster-binding NifX family protein